MTPEEIIISKSTEEQVRNYFKDANLDMRIAIAKREDLPEDLIRTLAADKDGNILLETWVEKAEPFKDGKANIVFGGIKMTVNTKGRILKKEQKQNAQIAQVATQGIKL